MDLRVVIFVPALAGSAIMGFTFLLFAANYYLTVLESTAAGAKEVQWEFGETLSIGCRVRYFNQCCGYQNDQCR